MKLRSFLFAVLICLAASPAYALRCGTYVIRVGDYKFDVLEKCGRPDYTDRRYAVAGVRLHHPKRTLDIEEFEEVLVEEWIYNFGPRRFKQYLLFENGVLKEIRDLGYGY